METGVREAEVVKASDEEGMQSVSAQKSDQMKRFHRTVRMNKKAIIAAVVIIAFGGILYSLRGFFVAVTVNGSPISRWSVIRELEKKSGEQALDAMVTKKLINDAAAKAGIIVSPADVDKEVATITEQVTKQGGTLALALEQQGMTEAEFRDQVVLQKELEGILGDATLVTDEDIASYMTQSKAATPKGTSEEDFKNQIRERLKGQKFNTEASKWVADAKVNAKINYFVPYAPKPLPIEGIDPEAMSSELK